MNTIRSSSAYPAYRGVIGTVALLGYLLAAAVGLGALVSGLGVMSQSFLLGLLALAGGAIGAALLFLMARLYKEGALILADIGDAVTDAASSGQGTYAAAAAAPVMPASTSPLGNRATF